MMTDQRSRRVLLVIGVLIGVLIGIAVLLALRTPPQFDPATPEGTVQGYFQAVLDGDEGLVFGYLTEALTQTLSDRCDAGEMRRMTPDAARVVITSTDVDGANAELGVEITESHGEGPFDAGSTTFDETLVMERHGDLWLIAEIPWPIHMDCLQEDR